MNLVPPRAGEDGNTTGGKLHHPQDKWGTTGIVCIDSPARDGRGIW